MKKKILVYLASSCIALSSLGQVNYQWVKSVGGYNADKGTSITTDGSGNVYVSTLLSVASGSIADFDPYGTGSGSFNFSPNSSGNCVIAKYDPDGNCLWRSSFTSDGISDLTFFVTSVAVSADGLHLYVAGGLQGTVDFGGTSLSSPTSMKPFIAQYDAATGTMIWVNDLGLSNVVVRDIAPVGSFVCLAAIAGSDAIFGKCDNSNGNIIFVDTLSGTVPSTITPFDIEVDANSNIGITGSFTGSIDFDASPGVATRISSGMADIFVAKYSLGGDYKWANSFGGSLNDVGTSLAFNSVGDTVYVAGVFQNGANFGPGALTVIGANNGFIVKCDNDDSNNGAYVDMERIETLNAGDSVVCSAISLDPQDNIFITGAFKGNANFDLAGSNDTLVSNGGFDLFFAKYNAGLAYAWSRSIGGTFSDGALDIATYNESLYMTGYYNDTVDFNIGNGFAKRTVNKDPQSSFTNNDIFILKYGIGNATIKGTVFYKNTNNNLDSLTQGTAAKKVRLYTQIMYDGNNALNLIAETDIDSYGHYMFTQIPDGQYLAFALPGDYYDSLYNLIPTYHTTDINNDTAYKWEEADLIATQSTAPASVANIYMVKSFAIPGTASLSGQIIFEGNYFRTTDLPSTTIAVRKPPNNALVAHTETDEFGNYSFDNLAADSCYRLYVNIAGLPMVSNYNPCPGNGESIANLNFVVDSASIDTVASMPSSVSQLKETSTNLLLYPNPNNGTVTIEFDLAQAQNISIELYNLLGEKVTTLLSESRQAGRVHYKYNAADKGLNAGVYFLYLHIGKEVITRKVVQMD